MKDLLPALFSLGTCLVLLIVVNEGLRVKDWVKGKVSGG